MEGEAVRPFIRGTPIWGRRQMLRRGLSRIALLTAGILVVVGIATTAASAAAPANDNFASAQVLSGPSGSVTGSNVDATKEAGEPNPAGNIGGASVWYTWTAPASGTATFATAGSSFDTIMGAYTGTSVSVLTELASNDDAGSSDLTSSVSFAVVSGATYRIVVDGYHGSISGQAAGSIQLA